MGSKLVFFLAAISFWHAGSALAACGETFEDIGLDCIRQNIGEPGEIKFLVSTEEIEKNKGNTYFFRTENGALGKFMIRSAHVSSNECSLSLDVTTYLGSEVYKPTGYLSISKEFNSWSSDRAGFDRTGAQDFRLYSAEGKCIFTSHLAQGSFAKKIKPPSLIQGRMNLYYAGNFLIFLSVFLIARAYFQDTDKFNAQVRLEDADKEDRKDVPDDLVLKLSRPFFRRYLTPVVQGMKSKKKIREKYKRKLASAGMTRSLTPEDLFAFKLFLIIGFPIVYLGLRMFLEEDWPLAAVPAVSVLGYIYPDRIWLRGKIAKRKAELIQNMPFIVDMLALSVEAGLDFMAAIQKVIDKAPPSAMSEEFEILIKETKVGASRAEGLRQLSWRADTLQISSFTATLIAADAVGASIAPILKTLSAEIRQKRSADAEKKGATAATKILFPTMFFIMPAVFIVIAAPIAMQFLGY